MEESEKRADDTRPGATALEIQARCNSEDAHLDDTIAGCIIDKSDTTITWDQVVGLSDAVQCLKEAIVLPARFPHLFTGNRTPWRAILLYGPPGTGKTYLAKAAASEMGTTFFSASSADLLSRWIGESEKLIKKLFSAARERRPSVVFIDEIDALCSSRLGTDSEHTRRLKTEFLVQLQGVSNNSEGVLLLAATNVPWELDTAIWRRFDKAIYIGLPDSESRMQLIKQNMGKVPHELSADDFEELTKLTERFSGSDIICLVRGALLEPIRRLQAATHFVFVPKDIGEEGPKQVWVACDPGTEGARPMQLMDVLPDELWLPLVTMADFRKHLQYSSPSVPAWFLSRYEQFMEERSLS